MAGFNILTVAAAAACLGVACAPALAASRAGAAEAVEKPALVEVSTGSTSKKITLTPRAAERLGIQVDDVRLDPSGRRVVPYSAVLYDLAGATWVYVRVAPMTFVREAVKIDTIIGESAYLSEGPSPGAKVLATGVPEVFGTEIGVGH